MKIKQTLAIMLVSAATTSALFFGYAAWQNHQQGNSFLSDKPGTGTSFASYADAPAKGPFVDFEMAATKASPGVVHVKTLTKSKVVQQQGPDVRNNPFREFFGDGFEDPFGGRGGQQQLPEQRASGSGVLVSADGFIVTNNHVVDGADELLVTLSNKKDYKATVVGKDPSSDLAVIKIEAKDLPYLQFANSDEVHLGQWVLAIGYPLNLETTVTSGIVSAKARNIGINSRQSKTPIESFIQTDAAINPGNSGGALVNTNGDIIGINSAIASPTGSYAGYAYAIPSNLVKKVVTDIIKFGSTQRAYLGVMYGSEQMSSDDRKKNNIPDGDGVYILDVAKGSAAEAAGIKKGDFITKVNGARVNTGTEMAEKIATLRPKDKIALTYSRNGNEQTGNATLKGDVGNYESMKEQVIEQLGATFEDVDRDKAASLKTPQGVAVKTLGDGIFTQQTRIKEGFIITRINNTKVTTVDELKAAIKSAGNSAIVSGVYPTQPQMEYQYAINDLQ